MSPRAVTGDENALPQPPHRGRHLLAEYRGCDPDVLDDLDAITRALAEAARAAGATVLSSHLHRFTPRGVSGVLIIMESHLSIHTWPERGYAAVDFYTCGAGDPAKAHAALALALRAQTFETMLIERGIDPPAPSLRVRA